MRLVFVLLCSLPFLCCAASSGFLIVANKGDQTVGIIDPAAGREVAVVPEGGTTGHELIASPDGRLAYVPIYGNSGVGKPGTDGTKLVVVDLGARKVVGNSRFRPRRAAPLPSVWAPERAAVRDYRARSVHQRDRSQNP